MSFVVAGTIIGFAVAGVKILQLRVKKKIREREIESLEHEDRVIFHEEIDEIDVVRRAKCYFAGVVCLFTIPVSFAAVTIRSSVGPAEKMIAAIGILVWYLFAYKFVDGIGKTGRL